MYFWKPFCIIRHKDILLLGEENNDIFGLIPQNDVNIGIGKAWTTVHWIISTWKSDLSNEINENSSKNYSRVSTIEWLHPQDSN